MPPPDAAAARHLPPLPPAPAGSVRRRSIDMKRIAPSLPALIARCAVAYAGAYFQLCTHIRTRRFCSASASSLAMQRRRTGDVDEIRRLTVEHQLEIIIHANILHQPDSFMAPLGNRIVNRSDREIRARTPSAQVSPRRNLAKTGNCTAQFR